MSKRKGIIRKIKLKQGRKLKYRQTIGVKMGLNRKMKKKVIMIGKIKGKRN